MAEWQPIETAPKDGTHIDLYAKRWRSQADDFIHSRFTDCWWSKGDHMVNNQPRWSGIEIGWFPTHWMPLPDPPKEPTR